MSVADQDFQDWEHIIVDGASTDGTLNIVQKYAHLKTISEPDNGIYDAMNKGVTNAEGEWLYFIGADDFLHDKEVLATVNKHLNSSVDVVYGDVVSSRFRGRYDGPFDVKKIRLRNICHQSIFIRKSVFDAVGGFNERYPAQADWDHNMRWMLNSQVRSKYIDVIVADYSDGGYSSINQDPDFQGDHIFNYLKYGQDVLPAKVRFRALAREMVMSMRFLDFKRFFVCGFKLFQELLKALKLGTPGNYQ